VSDEGPPRLDYADPQLPRPGTPPDGYLGYRSEEPPEGIRIGCIGWSMIAVAILATIYALLWWLGYELRRHGA
jgi:hypothetical protein